MCASSGYEVIIARSIDEIEAIRSIWEKLQSIEPRPVINADIDRYLSVVRGIGDKSQPYIMLIKKDGCPLTMAVCLFHNKWPLNLTLGYKKLFSTTVRCLEVVYGGAIACLDEAISEMLVRELMKVLRRNEADIVRFNHVKMDSCIFNSSRKMSGILTRNHFIRKECHWSMSIPENIDLFYKSLSKKHRGNIKRAVNKLYSEFAGQVNIVIYTKEDELNDAIKAASHISCSTYQHGLGCGFVDNSWMRELLTTAARCGWLRMSVLFVNQEPCAFQIGLRYGEQYMLDQIGFDPKWGKYEVGTILFVKTLEDICADKYMKCIDYGFGDAAYKRSYGDKQWQEVTVHIHASRPYSVFLNMLQSAMAGFTTGVHKVLDSIGLTARIKRYWRGRLSKS